MIALNKLRWQCRRGTRELDFLLSRYLEEKYLQADPAEQRQFAALLEQEDDLLIGILLNDAPGGRWADLVDRLKHATESGSG